MAKAKSTTIEQEMVSSPTRPPRYHPFFTIIDADNNQERFFTHTFRTAYAAHYWIDSIFTACTDRGCTVNWPSSVKVVFTDPETQRKLVIKEDLIEDLIEYEPNKEESEWTPPYPDSAQLARVSEFWQKMSSYHTNTSEPDEQPKKRQPAPKTKAPSDPNQVTVAQLAQEANIPANKARQILRKANFQKPPTGWTYAKNDPTIKTIRDLFAKGNIASSGPSASPSGYSLSNR